MVAAVFIGTFSATYIRKKGVQKKSLPDPAGQGGKNGAH